MPGTVLRPSENKTQPLPSQKAVSRALGVDGCAHHIRLHQFLSAGH